MNHNDENLKWEEVSTDHIIRDQWIDFRRCEYRMPDGSTAGPFYNYSRRNYAVIVARDTEGRFICVRQYRHGIREVTTEFPAGGIERSGGQEYGTDAKETALHAAVRELEEETGYVSDHWTHLLTIPSNATISDNYAFIFFAEDCRRVSQQHLDETEFLSVELLTEDQLKQLIDENRFQQAMHILGYMLSLQHR